MALISPQHIGKTELIHHCFAQRAIQKIVYFYSRHLLNQFRQRFGGILGKAMIDELRPKGRSAWGEIPNGALFLSIQKFLFDINGLQFGE